MFCVVGEASREHKCALQQSSWRVLAVDADGSPPCLNASRRLCCPRSQTLSSILPHARPGLPKTPANWLSDLCHHLAPSTPPRDTIFPHMSLRARSVIHGHFRATSKIAYIHDPSIDTSVVPPRNPAPRQNEHLFIRVTQTGLEPIVDRPPRISRRILTTRPVHFSTV